MNYKKMLTPAPVPKHFLGYGYIRPENYELYQKLDDTELTQQSYNTFNDKVNYFEKLLWSLRKNGLMIII